MSKKTIKITKPNSPTFEVDSDRWEKSKEHYLKDGYSVVVEKPKEEPKEQKPAPAKNK